MCELPDCSPLNLTSAPPPTPLPCRAKSTPIFDPASYCAGESCRACAQHLQRWRWGGWMVFGCVAVAMRPVVRVKGCCVGGGRAAGGGRAGGPPLWQADARFQQRLWILHRVRQVASGISSSCSQRSRFRPSDRSGPREMGPQMPVACSPHPPPGGCHLAPHYFIAVFSDHHVSCSTHFATARSLVHSHPPAFKRVAPGARPNLSLLLARHKPDVIKGGRTRVWRKVYREE